jgi:hypothetical protein
MGEFYGSNNISNNSVANNHATVSLRGSVREEAPVPNIPSSALWRGANRQASSPHKVVVGQQSAAPADVRNSPGPKFGSQFEYGALLPEGDSEQVRLKRATETLKSHRIKLDNDSARNERLVKEERAAQTQLRSRLLRMGEEDAAGNPALARGELLSPSRRFDGIEPSSYSTLSTVTNANSDKFSASKELSASILPSSLSPFPRGRTEALSSSPKLEQSRQFVEQRAMALGDALMARFYGTGPDAKGASR